MARYRYFFGVLLACALLLNGSAAYSQYGRYFLESLPQLTAEDIAMLKSTGREGMDGKPEGTTLSWRNDKSGNSGTVTLVRRFTSEGQECRELRHDLDLARQPDQTYTTVICRQQDGTWKVLQAPAR